MNGNCRPTMAESFMRLRPVTPARATMGIPSPPNATCRLYRSRSALRVSASEGAKFAQVVSDVVTNVKAVGPNSLFSEEG